MGNELRTSPVSLVFMGWFLVKNCPWGGNPQAQLQR
jgi:hypothetical protein